MPAEKEIERERPMIISLHQPGSLPVRRSPVRLSSSFSHPRVSPFTRTFFLLPNFLPFALFFKSPRLFPLSVFFFYRAFLRARSIRASKSRVTSFLRRATAELCNCASLIYTRRSDVSEITSRKIGAHRTGTYIQYRCERFEGWVLCGSRAETHTSLAFSWRNTYCSVAYSDCEVSWFCHEDSGRYI